MLFPTKLPTYLQLKESIKGIIHKIYETSDLPLYCYKFFGVFANLDVGEAKRARQAKEDVDYYDTLIEALEKKIDEKQTKGHSVTANHLNMDENGHYSPLRVHFDPLEVNTTGWRYVVICDLQQGCTIPDFESTRLLGGLNTVYSYPSSMSSHLGQPTIQSMNSVLELEKIPLKKKEPDQIKPSGPIVNPKQETPPAQTNQPPAIKKNTYKAQQPTPVQQFRREEAKKPKEEPKKPKEEERPKESSQRPQPNEAKERSEREWQRKNEAPEPLVSLRKGLCGLENPGKNWCYLNSSIQALRHCDIKEILDCINNNRRNFPQENDDANLAIQFYNLITYLNDGQEGHIESVEHFFGALRKSLLSGPDKKDLVPGTQEDSHQIMIDYLGKIHTVICAEQAKKGVEALKDHSTLKYSELQLGSSPIHQTFGCIEQRRKSCLNPQCKWEPELTYQWEATGLTVQKLPNEQVGFLLFDLENPNNDAHLRFTMGACMDPTSALQNRYPDGNANRSIFLLAFRAEGQYELKSLERLDNEAFKREKGSAIVFMDGRMKAAELIVVVALAANETEFGNKVMFKVKLGAKVSELRAEIDKRIRDLGGSSQEVSFLKGETRNDQSLSTVFAGKIKVADGFSILAGLAPLNKRKAVNGEEWTIGEVAEMNDQALTIHQIIENRFRADENRAVVCAGCKNPGVRYELKLHTPPKTLILMLKDVDTQKNFIDFKKKYEFTLDPKHLVTESVVEYELVSAVIRTGSGRESGHYYTHAKRDDLGWHQFNDSSVSVIREADVQIHLAYMLIFRRKNGERGQAKAK